VFGYAPSLPLNSTPKELSQPNSQGPQNHAGISKFPKQTSEKFIDISLTSLSSYHTPYHGLINQN
jgi:hypothetical protein